MSRPPNETLLRQQALERKRRETKDEHERQKATLIAETEKARPSAHKFVGEGTSVEDILKDATVGLVRLEDFQQRRVALEEKAAREAAGTNELKEEKRVKKRKKATQKSKLSFGDEEEDDVGGSGISTPGAEENGNTAKKPKLGKNPGVDTSFLPDREREEEERKDRERLRKEWLQQQEDIKNEDIEVTYSYWDGTGHRRSVLCKKGDMIEKFLEKVRQQSPELRGVALDNLMYIKEDLIIPHNYTFYYFILNRCRGKSGPLFNFDVHDDVRLLADATVEKDESHAGKVVERSWYNRNRHIFPASRWEPFDPAKNFDRYTVAG